MRKGKILTKISNTAEKVLTKHSEIFMKRKFYMLAGILLTCLALSVGQAFAQSADPLVETGAAVSIAWTLVMGGLVWFMQLGLAFLGVALSGEKPGQLLDKKLP
jgi:hypothetical protein